MAENATYAGQNGRGTIPQGTPDEVFSKIISQYGRMVYRICYDVLENDADAKDAAQETYMLAFRRMDTLRNDSMGHWLYSIARNRAIDFYRKNHRGMRAKEALISEINDGLFEPADPAPYDICERGQESEVRSAAIMAAFSNLKPEIQNVFSMWEEHTECNERGRAKKGRLTAVAENLDIPIGTVRNRMHRGRRVFIRYLKAEAETRGIPFEEFGIEL